jgi:hypothetical protein
MGIKGQAIDFTFLVVNSATGIGVPGLVAADFTSIKLLQDGTLSDDKIPTITLQDNSQGYYSFRVDGSENAYNMVQPIVDLNNDSYQGYGTPVYNEIENIIGTNTVEITIVSATDHITPLDSVKVIILNNDQTLALNTLYTNNSGIVTTALDTGMYKVRLIKSGYNFTVPETMIVVGGTVYVTFEGTLYVSTSIADKTKISIISGIPIASIDDMWPLLAENMVKSLLNRDFASAKNHIQYIDTVNRNDYVRNYDRVTTFVLDRIPVSSVTSVIYLPDSDSPEILVADTDYFVDLPSGCIKLSNSFEMEPTQRAFKITYAYDYSTAPQEVKDYANFMAAFLIESGVARGESGGILKEVEMGRYREMYFDSATALKAKYGILGKLEQDLVDKYKYWGD